MMLCALYLVVLPRCVHVVSFIELMLCYHGCETHLGPFAVAAGHVCVVDGAEEALGGDVLGQAREKLSHVDEVHVQEHVLVQAQDPQGRAEKELLSISAEHVPHTARHV